jgi:hypothetical protein
VPGEGIPCPRCGRPTQIREHSQITERHRRQAYYFTRWFRCMSGDCPTTLIMRAQFKVPGTAAAYGAPESALSGQDLQQTGEKI